ncbi:putative membrane protein [Sporomusaceae bacterium BoRhaA]|uniref:hypothetical protein n=1 Tax=Pelorhabdus rhamnosifermentans TaxID=2772457 RepID=UPI001C05FC0D|nr:hypothetical protein [Pelorhabdus rhamnosifermentans]MBU2702494.1 putative membrane protein [Pelorhabdus rhamnosifermentans]
MNQVWVIIFAIMIVSTIVKNVFFSMFAWVMIDVLVLAVCYLVLRRYPYIDLSKSMIFLTGLTAINILTDLNIIGGILGGLLLLALLIWTLFSERIWPGRRPRLRHKWHK